MTTLVTGATGFVGSHVAHQLVSSGANVRVLVRPSSNFRLLEDLRADVIGGLASWPRDCQGLLTDVPYASEWRPDEEPSRRLDRAGWRSLQQRVERWEQTNLRKFLRLIHEHPASISAGTV